MKRAGWVAAIVLLVVTGLSGLVETAMPESDSPTTGWQQLVWFSVALYGVLGILGGVGLARRRPWCVTVSAVWAMAVVCAATVASFAYSDPAFAQEGTLTGTIAAFVSTSVLGALIVWAARVATRAPKVPQQG